VIGVVVVVIELDRRHASEPAQAIYPRRVTAKEATVGRPRFGIAARATRERRDARREGPRQDR
jgi:hypothetical protein